MDKEHETEDRPAEDIRDRAPYVAPSKGDKERTEEAMKDGDASDFQYRDWASI
jgi:hypothetical protein